MPPTVYDDSSRIHKLVYSHLRAMEKDGTLCPGSAAEVFNLVFSPDRDGRPPALTPGRALRLVYERIMADPQRYLGPDKADAGSGLDVLQRLRAQGHLAAGAGDEIQRTLVGVGRMDAGAAAERIADLLEEDNKGHLRAERPGPDVFTQRARAVIDMLAEHISPAVGLDDLAVRWRDLGRMNLSAALHCLASRLRNPTVAADVCVDGVPAAVDGYTISRLAERATADNPYFKEVADRIGGAF
jgi:hypothetical protein